MISFLCILKANITYHVLYIITDPNMPVFGLLASLVIGLGALVGGVIGILLPKIGTGIAIGFLLALAIEVVIMQSAYLFLIDPNVSESG